MEFLWWKKLSDLVRKSITLSQTSVSIWKEKNHRRAPGQKNFIPTSSWGFFKTCLRYEGTSWKLFSYRERGKKYTGQEEKMLLFARWLHMLCTFLKVYILRVARACKLKEKRWHNGRTHFLHCYFISSPPAVASKFAQIVQKKRNLRARLEGRPPFQT